MYDRFGRSVLIRGVETNDGSVRQSRHLIFGSLAGCKAPDGAALSSGRFQVFIERKAAPRGLFRVGSWRLRTMLSLA
jgi:hypothetical protein